MVFMQMHDNREAPPAYESAHEYTEQREYIRSPHVDGPSTEQPFQQQTYYPPQAGDGPASYSHTCYGEPGYGQQPFAGAPPLSDIRFSALLSYAFGWVTGLLFLLFGGRDRFVRFHALQSLFFFGALNVIDIGLFGIIRGSWWHHGHLVALLCLLLFLALNFIAFISWIVVIVQAARGLYFRLPFVGELVARCFNLNPVRPRW
jgi:uncharacterized membrane protein